MRYAKAWAILVLLASEPVNACEVCGCGSLASSKSTLGWVKSRHLFSTSFQYSAFESRHAASLLKEDKALLSREEFQSTTLGGSHAIRASRWRVFWQLPLVAIQKRQGESLSSSFSLGDASLGFSFLLQDDTLFGGKWISLAKLAFKTPTGNYQESAVDEMVSRYMFAGTGTWDTRLSLASFWKGKKVFLQARLMYQLNGKTSEQLDWGDVYRAAIGVAKPYQIKDWTLLPGLGLHLESRQKDRYPQAELLASGYKLVLIKPHFTLAYKKATIGASYFVPIYSAIADNRVDLKQLWTINVGWRL